MPHRGPYHRSVDRLLAWYRVGSSVGAVVALVIANAIPLAGVVFLGWNVWTILIIYWLENGVVGVYNVLRMRKAHGTDTSDASNWRLNGKRPSEIPKDGLIPFFIMHYGMFWIGHGVFVLLFPVFGGMGDGTDPDLATGFEFAPIPFAVIALAISHGVSYWRNFLRGGEYRRVSASGQMFAPYGRLVVLHITIIFGGMAIAGTGAPAAAVAILVALKIVMDLGFHLAEHRKAGPAPRATATIGGSAGGSSA